MIKEYKERLKFLNELGLLDRAHDLVIQSDMTVVKEQIISDVEFLTTGKICFLNISVRCISERFNLVLQNVNKDYEAKQSGNLKWHGMLRN